MKSKGFIKPRTYFPIGLLALIIGIQTQKWIFYALGIAFIARSIIVKAKTKSLQK